MWRKFLDPFALVACYLPMLVMLAVAVMLVLLPVLQAPSVATMARYTRKLLRGRPDASDDELRRILRARFLPRWATEPPPETEWTHVFIFGLAGILLIQMYYGIRSFVLLQVMEPRIYRAIELADSD